MKILVLLSLLLISFNVMADKRKEFIRKYKHIAIREMERTGIPASITLAQGILESGCGESELAVNANNHFGIKNTIEQKTGLKQSMGSMRNRTRS